MADLTITHLGLSGDESPIRLGDFYIDLFFGTPRVVEDYPAGAIPDLSALQAEMAAGRVSLSVTYSADEIASGLQSPPNSVDQDDIVPVAAATLLAGAILLRVPLVAGAGGAPDDIPVIPAGSLTKRYRVLDIWAEITANVAGEAVQIRDQAAGVGNLLADVDANAAALRVGPNTVYGGVTDAPGATIGLIVRRTDDAIAGTLYALLRPES
jgi:hypothetical protein